MSEIASESGHYYDTEGNPAYTVVGKNGKERSTTVGDARKLGLVPSVTTILNVAAKPGLEVWKQNNILQAAATLPKIEGESVDDWCKRVVADAQEQGKQARDRGTEIHAAIERYLALDDTKTEYLKHCGNAYLAIKTLTYDSELGDDSFFTEKSFSSPLGYGGKVDFSCPGFVADFKTTDKPLDGLKTWDEHAMQLAAYREGLGMPDARCAIIYVHVDGDCKLIELSEEELQRGWKMFLACFELWKAQKRYEPCK